MSLACSSRNKESTSKCICYVLMFEYLSLFMYIYHVIEIELESPLGDRFLNTFAVRRIASWT